MSDSWNGWSQSLQTNRIVSTVLRCSYWKFCARGGRTCGMCVSCSPRNRVDDLNLLSRHADPLEPADRRLTVQFSEKLVGLSVLSVFRGRGRLTAASTQPLPNIQWNAIGESVAHNAERTRADCQLFFP